MLKIKAVLALQHLDYRPRALTKYFMAKASIILFLLSFQNTMGKDLQKLKF